MKLVFFEKVKKFYKDLPSEKKESAKISFIAFMITFTIYYFIGFGKEINNLFKYYFLHFKQLYFWIFYLVYGAFFFYSVKYLFFILKKDIEKYHSNLKNKILIFLKYLFIGSFFGSLAYFAILLFQVGFYFIFGKVN